MGEIRRRTLAVGSFPDGHSASLLAAAGLRYVSGSRWGTRRYMDMKRLNEFKAEAVASAGWTDNRRDPHGGRLVRIVTR